MIVKMIQNVKNRMEQMKESIYRFNKDLEVTRISKQK